MCVLVTCKNEEDPIKNEVLECSQHFSGDLSRHSRAANSAVHGPFWPNFKLVRDVIDVLVTCKNQEDLIKKEGARVFITFSPS